MSNLPEPASRSVQMPNTIGKNAADLIDNTPDQRWLNPISMSALKHAVENKRETVHLNGKQYKITYGLSTHSKVLDTDIPCVYLKRTDGMLAPQGYVRLSRILDFDFEKGE